MKKLPLLSLMLLAVIIIGSQFGCSKKSDSSSPSTTTTTSIDCTGISPSFSATVFALIQAKCATSGCHDAGSTNSGGPFTTYAQISAKASNIKAQVSSGAMPKSGSLSASEKSSIVCWVSSGAANN